MTRWHTERQIKNTNSRLSGCPTPTLAELHAMDWPGIGRGCYLWTMSSFQTFNGVVLYRQKLLLWPRGRLCSCRGFFRNWNSPFDTSTSGAPLQKVWMLPMCYDRCCSFACFSLSHSAWNAADWSLNTLCCNLLTCASNAEQVYEKKSRQWSFRFLQSIFFKIKRLSSWHFRTIKTAFRGQHEICL